LHIVKEFSFISHVYSRWSCKYRPAGLPGRPTSVVLSGQ